MPSPSATPTPITPPRVPLIDARTGLIDRAWYMFFVSLYREANTIIDTNVGPDSESLIASYAAELEALAQAVGTQFNAESMLASLEIAINVLRDQHDLLPPPETGELQQQIDTLRQEVQTQRQPELGSMAPLEQDNVPWLTFNTAPLPVPTAVGSMYWDGGTTLGVQATANVLIRVGESEYVYAKASSAITKGQLCYHTGAVGASGVITAAPTPLALVDPNQIVGVAAESIALNGFGLIQISGDLRGFNTTGSSVGETWADGDALYYNPAYVGSMTKVKPSAPNQKTYIGEVINAATAGSGSMHIRIVPGSVLGGTDSNVQFGTLSTGDLIQYDATLGYWKNVASTSAGVTSFSAGTTGLTPSSPTTGNVVLAGTLAVANGGTGTGTAGIGAFNNITGYAATGATGTTSTNLVFSTNPTITNLVVNGYQYIENSTTYNTSANAIQEIGASNDTSVNNNATYRWRWIVEGNATDQNFVLYAYRRGTTTIERARYTSSGFSLPTGQTYQINNTTVLSGSALGSGITGSSLTSVGTVTTGTWNATAIGAAYGGTGQTTYTIGDLLYASGTTTLSKLADVATGNALISGGVGVAPSWGKIGLTTHVSGTLPVANGGTGVTTFGGTNRLLYTTTTDTLSSIATANTSALVTSSAGAPSWASGTTANRVLRTDGTTVSFGQVALATDVSGTLPVANSLLYYNTATKTMSSGSNYDWYSIDFGVYSGRSALVQVVFSLVSGGGGSRVWYRDSLVVETGGAALSENNITAINGANGTLSFVLSGATLTVRTTTSASSETARMSIMVQGYEMTSSRISVL